MLQWELCKFVPHVETIVSKWILYLHSKRRYTESEIRGQLQDLGSEPLTPKDNENFQKEFAIHGDASGKIKGRDLIRFMNKQLSLKKTQDGQSFPVNVMERGDIDINDAQLENFVSEIRAVYDLPEKKPSQWIYLGMFTFLFFIIFLLYCILIVFNLRCIYLIRYLPIICILFNPWSQCYHGLLKLSREVSTDWNQSRLLRILGRLQFPSQPFQEAKGSNATYIFNR